MGFPESYPPGGGRRKTFQDQVSRGRDATLEERRPDDRFHHRQNQINNHEASPCGHRLPGYHGGSRKGGGHPFGHRKKPPRPRQTAKRNPDAAHAGRRRPPGTRLRPIGGSLSEKKDHLLSFMFRS